MRKEKFVFALGFFDGVHLGHQALLAQCCRLALEMGVRTAAITFEAHPQSLFSDNVPGLINSAQDRQRLLRHYGMDTIHSFPVTPQVMSTPWRTFLDALVEGGAAGFVCGDDFRFGAGGEGNAQKLREYCRERELPWAIVPEQSVNGLRVSSTYIRRQLEQGDMETAVKFLGHPHILTGNVVRGHQLGRRLGIPTANLLLPPGIAAPKFGVYACRALVEGVWYPAVTNVGTRPTVSGTGVTVEPWILDYAGDLYDREITLEFYSFLRPEEKFPSLEALQAQIRRDAAFTREFLSGNS